LIVTNGLPARKQTGIEVTQVLEGKETTAFWQAIGGQQTYPLKLLPSRQTARLFQCSVGTGAFEIKEVLDYSQVRKALLAARS